ncbi:MAG: hypothetical protein ACC649_03825, partial [Myxococcota bacterium]
GDSEGDSEGYDASDGSDEADDDGAGDGVVDSSDSAAGQLIPITSSGLTPTEPLDADASAPANPFVEDSASRLLVETLTAANGPPSEGVDNENLEEQGLAPQLIFLNLRGAEGITFDGPIRIEGIEVGEFRAPVTLAGGEDLVVAALLESLQARFDPALVDFTTELPDAGTEFSTIYLGPGGSEFGDEGSLIGVSEQVDKGNIDRTDQAFVFSNVLESVLRDSLGVGVGVAGISSSEAAESLLDPSAYGQRLATYVSHEAGHLMGSEHLQTGDPGDDPLAEVAFRPYTHVEIARDVLRDLFGDPEVQGDEDNQLTINGEQYEVHPKILVALRDYSSFYFAGAVGPDGFPDPLMGSAVLHPTDTGIWLTRILDMAWAAQEDPSFGQEERLQILAWSFGFLTHVAGDQWAHTVVNEFAEGVAPGVAEVADSDANLGNLLRHFLLESYIADASSGLDLDPTRTVLPDGDVSDDSSPGIPYDAPIRFIYETLIRPFAADPSPLVTFQLGEKEILEPDGDLNLFERSAALAADLGSFIDDGFKVGQRITVAGFSDAANNGVFHVTAVTASTLSVVESLVTEVPGAANGDETIQVFIAYSAPTTLTVDAGSDSFVRSTGNFREDGFLPGQRFAAYGFTANQGDYLVSSVSDDGKTLTVHQDLVAGDETGSGDEQLVQQGPRGSALDALFSLRDKLELIAIGRGPKVDFGDLVSQLVRSAVDDGVSVPALGDVVTAYLYNWIDEINEGVRNWASVGLAFTRTMFDPQMRRDVQNKLAKDAGADTLDNSARAAIEDSVGILDILIYALDDPNQDGSKNDSVIDKHLLPMLGLPEELGFLREALADLFSEIGDVLASEGVDNTPDDALADADASITDYLKQFIEDVWGFSFEVFDFLTQSNSKLDLASVEIAGKFIPVFKPGDHEKADGYLGMTPVNHHAPLPPSFMEVVTLPGATLSFYPNAMGALSGAAEFSKSDFPSYANAVTLSKMLLLQEDAVDSEPTSAHLNQLSKLFNDNLAGATSYDASLLNLNGAHGGNVLTATLPGVAGADDSHWLGTIDSDQEWRSDNYTTVTALFRV